MHQHDQPCIAEELLAKLIPALIRSGDIREETVLRLADEIDAEAEDETITRAEELNGMSTALRMWAMEAAGPPLSQEKANNRRKRFRVIEGDPET